MLNYIRSVFLLLDVAPLGGVGVLLLPVLVVAIVIIAAAVLVHTIRKRKREHAQQTKDTSGTEQDKDSRE